MVNSRNQPLSDNTIHPVKSAPAGKHPVEVSAGKKIRRWIVVNSRIQARDSKVDCG